MKPRILSSARLCFLFAALLSAQSASAVDFYWKGVNANWSLAGSWFTTAAGTSTTTIPASATTSDLFFNITSANTASSSISNAGGARSARSLTFGTSGTTNMRAGGSSSAASLLTIGDGGITLGANSGNVTLGDNAASYGTLTVALAASQIWTNNSTNTLTVNGAISGIGFGLTKSGSGQIRLNGVNGYTGTTAVAGGILRLGNADALPGGTGASGTSGLTISGGGVVGLPADFTRALGTGTSQVQWTGSGGFAAYGGDRTVNLGGNVTPTTVGWTTTSFLTGAQALVLSAADADGTLIWQNGLSFAGGVRTIQVNNGSAAVDARITGKLTGGTSSGLNKTGAGTLELTNANDYTGATNVNAGTLLIGTSGSLANTSAVTVGGAAATGTPTLGGGGTLVGATTIAAAGGGVVGTHAPGVAGVSGGVGSQTFSNNLTYQSGSIFEWDISTAANTSDSVSVGGSLTVDSGAIFKIVSSTAFTDVFWNTTRNWNVFGGKDFDAFTLNFVANDTPQVAGDFASRGNFTFTNSGATLTWTAVPEPSSALAGLLLGAGLLRRRRK